MHKPSSNRRLALMAIACAGATLLPLAASAQAYPSKPITMIVPFSAGGTTDILARIVGQALSEELGQSVIIDNRAGAGGNIGGQAAARAPADGYTLFMGTVGTHAINQSLYKKMPFDPVKDFTPLSRVANVPNLLVAHPSQPFKTVREMIAYAKANPGKLNYATSGNGTIVHLNSAAFSAQAGIDMTHVPYKGTALSIPDLIAGQVHVLFDSLPTGMPHVVSGKVRALGVTSEKRSGLAPELPTLAESGLPGFSSVTWFGVYLPAGAPPALVDRVHQAFSKAVQSPEVKASLAKLGVDPAAPGTPAQFSAMVKSDSARWASVIRQHKISVQ